MMDKRANLNEEELKIVNDISDYFCSVPGYRGESINERYVRFNGPKKYLNLTPPDGDEEIIRNFFVSDPVCTYTLRKPWKYMRLSGKPVYRIYTWFLNLIDNVFEFSLRKLK